jgi:hypothetical protein
VSAVALLVVGVARGGSHHRVAPLPIASASSTASTVPVSPAGSGNRSLAGSAAGWPSASGACGSTRHLPQQTLALHYAGVPAMVVVGGAGVQTVSVDPLSTTTVSVAPDRPGWLVTALVAGPDGVYAKLTPCDVAPGPEALYRIEAGVAHPLAASPSQFLFGGAHHAWAEQYPPQTTSAAGSAVNAGPALTPLDGGPTITLPPNASLLADTAAGLVVDVDDPINPDAPPSVKLLDAATGAVVRTVIDGYAIAAQGHALIAETSGCTAQPAPVTCALQRIDLTTGQPTRSYALPAGRLPVSDVVFSPDGQRIAFQLARASKDPRFDTDFPPSDVAVLHLDTDRLVIVPGLEFAPKTSAGLAFDTTGASLLATISQGNGGELLIWQEGMTAPALLTPLRGPLFDAPPILLTQP